MKSAIITADIVNSTQLTKSDHKKLMKLFTTILTGHLYEFFRGDSFQVFCKSADEALRIILKLRVAALKISSETVTTDVRISIGIGVVKTPVKALNTASGEAFILSGRAFDKMQKDERLVITCDENNKCINLGLKLTSQFIDYILQRMTVKQATVVSELLMNKTQMETAKKIKKSQVTVHKHAQAAGWPELEKLLKNYSALIQLIES